MDPSSVSSDAAVKEEGMETNETQATPVPSEPSQPDSTESAMQVYVIPDPDDGSSTAVVIEEDTVKTENTGDVAEPLDVKSTNNNNNNNNNKPKSKKKKNVDPSAPRQPLSGYMRYLNERRETVRGENPSLSFADITKLLAEEWNHLPQEKKQPYVEAGQQDRERYTRELTAYKKTEAYRISVEKQIAKKARKARESAGENGMLSDTQEVTDEVKKENGDGSDIHIFTEEFLELNRACEAEFKQLRGQNTEFEERNALLEKHNEAMMAAIEKMEKANLLLRSHNDALEKHCEDLRSNFVSVFQHVAVPGKNKPPTEDTVDDYISQLQQYLAKAGESDPISIQLRECVQKLDFDV